MGTWGVELWDQRDLLEKHTQSAIDFFEKCANFVKERVSIEQTYAKSLRKLVKSYQFKKKEEEDLPYTYQHAFKSFLLVRNRILHLDFVYAEQTDYFLIMFFSVFFDFYSTIYVTYTQ